MEDDTPSLKLQKLGFALERFIIPLLPYGQQINMARVVEIVSKWSNLPELEDVVLLQQPLQGQEEQGNPNPEGKSAKPSQTKRTYERINRPGATQHGKTDVMTRILMGAGVQNTEAAALNRPIR
jgi:hypothetical protein